MTFASEDELRARLAAGDTIERPDEMSADYARELKKMLRIAADTELRSVPMLFGYFETGVPYRYVQPILSIAQDELGHAHADLRLLEALGEDVDALVYDRPAHEWASPYLFDMPIDSWPEIAVVEGLGEFVGGLLVRNVLHATSYGPWRRALVRVDAEENFHVKFGQALMRELARDEAGKQELQRAVDWIFPLLLEFVGPPPKTPDPQIDYRLKGKKTDGLRDDFLRYAVPFCESLKLRVPVHYDRDADRYVLEFSFPCAFDPERKRWDLGRSVAWADVFARWKERGPRADRNLAWIRAGRT
ncbi:MAG: phenylacetate-CoA oxygenase subunit PaaI [Candidatus Eremiobacteraeota bacterium]|nr:phenylacetate-CoA oxygenase subunit PaaI [Candidatus Eremiobacteraeota bacterium]